MTALGTDAFTGTTGAAWASPWTTGTTPTGGSTTIQANAGRMVTGSATGYSFNSRIARRYGTTAQAAVVMKVKFRHVGTEVFPHMWVRADTSMVGDTGYYVNVDVVNNTWGLNKTSGFTDSTIGSAITQTFTANTWYWLVFGVVGTAVKAKVWQDGTSEPAWQSEVTDSTVSAAGQYGLGAYPGNAGSNYMEYDDFSAYTTFAEAVTDVRSATVAGTATASSTINGVSNRFSTVSGAATASSSISGTNVRPGAVTGASTASGVIQAQTLTTAFVNGTVMGSSTITATADDGTAPDAYVLGQAWAMADIDAVVDVGRYFRTPAFKQHPRDRHPLIARTWIPVGMTLLKANGSYRTYIDTDPDLITAADKVYLGGHLYFVETAEAEDLMAAGYGQFLSSDVPVSGDDDIPVIDYSQYGAGTYGTGPYGA